MMQKLLILIIATTFLFACNKPSEENADEKATIEQSNSEQLEPAQILKKVSPDSLIQSYKRLRISSLPNASEIEIDGSVFLTQGEVTIINFSETIDFINHYSFAIVLNGSDSIDNHLEGYDKYEDISDLLTGKLGISASLFPGNFKEAPSYTIDASIVPLILVDNSSYRTSISIVETLYFLQETSLIKTGISAVTEGEGAVCENIDGFAEDFVLGEHKNNVVVDVRQYQYDNCIEEFSIHYQKIWEKSGEIIRQGRINKELVSHPKYKLQFMTDSLYYGLPKTLYQLMITESDTIIGTHTYEINEHTTKDGERVDFRALTSGILENSTPILNLSKDEPDKGLKITSGIYNYEDRALESKFQFSVLQDSVNTDFYYLAGVPNSGLYTINRNGYKESKEGAAPISAKD